MPAKRPNAIELPERLPSLPARAFARGSGQTFNATDTTIELYDEIGGLGITARDLRAALRSAAGDVTLRINSPGGSVFDGLAMFNDVVAFAGHVRVEITGIAASIASIIAMAGDEIAIAPNAFMMIHNSHAIAAGDAAGHEEVADVLRKIDGQMAATYAARSGKDVRAIKTMMDAETWFNGSEAKAAGLATDLIEAVEPRAKFDLSVFAKTPAELLADVERVDPNKITNRRDYEAFLRDAGMSRSRAKAFSAGYRLQNQRDADDASEVELAAHIAAQANRFKEMNFERSYPRVS